VFENGSEELSCLVWRARHNDLAEELIHILELYSCPCMPVHNALNSTLWTTDLWVWITPRKSSCICTTSLHCHIQRVHKFSHDIAHYWNDVFLEHYKPFNMCFHFISWILLLPFQMTYCLFPNGKYMSHTTYTKKYKYTILHYKLQNSHLYDV
jgi:hypothetical protein